MSETMSNSTDQWMQFYNQTAVQPSLLGPSGNDTPTTASRLSPDAGRVAKPVRRRSRASRRTPTTLLSTDTANFRAMVQQFTGSPAGPHYIAGAGSGAGAGFSFAGPGSFNANPNNPAVMVPAALQGYNPGAFHHQSQPYAFSQGAGAGAGHGHGHETFLQRLSSGRQAISNGVSVEGFLMGSVGASSNDLVAAPGRATSDLMAAANGSDERRSNNFMF